MNWSKGQLKELLDEEANRFERPEFIELDPISIPHSFDKKEDIEISGFLTATISWGNRKSIINNARKWMHLMENAPYDFVMNHKASDLRRMKSFVHRTFNGEDAAFFMQSLKNLYSNHNGLESAFCDDFDGEKIETAIVSFRNKFFEIRHPARSSKHVSNPQTGSSSKRINMFLRWMVRSSQKGVDFGLWKGINKSSLMLPLDVHTGNVARELGLLQRSQNDWKALEEVMSELRTFDSIDPVKYDFALFGMGVQKVL